MKTLIKHFENEKIFIKTSVEYILARALACVEKKDLFTLVLAGGNTPIKIYETMTQEPYSKVFPWDKTYFFLGDERVLPSSNPDSNAYSIDKIFNSFGKIPANNIILPDVNVLTPQEIARNYELKIKGFFKSNEPKFDLFLLGMGLDGHTASLFPDDPVWRNNETLVISTSKATGTPEVYRISMGLSLINNSENLLMLISGNEKKELADKLLTNLKENSNPLNSPIPKIKPTNEFTWHINSGNN